MAKSILKGMHKSIVGAAIVVAVYLLGCGTNSIANTAKHDRVSAVNISTPISYTETLTLTGTTNTAAKYAGGYSIVGISVVSTGTAAGTWTVQYSNDGVTFDTYTLTTIPPVAAGAGQTFGITLDSYEFQYVRLLFTFTSGSGSATVVTQIKGA